MTDTPKIEPALTPEEWERRDLIGYLSYAVAEIDFPSNFPRPRGLEGNAGLHVLIALANAALPDSDPRKITREMVTALRLVHVSRPEIQAHLDSLAAALESYLPPEMP